MSREDQPQDSEFIKHATAALKHTGSAASEAARSTLKGLKESVSWENFGHAVGTAAMVGAASKAVSAVADRVTKKPERKSIPDADRRQRYRR